MNKYIALTFGLLAIYSAEAQTYKFDFTQSKKAKDGYTKITAINQFTKEKGYGYDLQSAPDGKNTAPFFFSVSVPDGNYRVTALIGSKTRTAETSLRGESRRLFFENQKTKLLCL